MRHRALLAWRSPPRFNRWRWVRPEDAGMAAAPHRCAKAASPRSRWGLSPAVTSSCPAVSTPYPRQGHQGGRAQGDQRLELEVEPVDLDGLQPVGARKPGQPGPVGAGAFHPDALHWPKALGPGHQGDIAAGRGRERLGATQPPGVVQDRGHVQVQVGVDPDSDRCRWGCHALQWPFLSGLIGQGRHAPVRTVDSTAMGPLGQAPDLLNRGQDARVCSP
jgi:hypothetical protein